MNHKIFLALALCGLLAACNKAEETAPAADSAAPAAEATTEAAPAEGMSEAAPAAEAAPAETAAADLPKECSDYISRAEACFAKAAPDAAAMMKTSFDATVAEWKNAVDKSSLGEACKQMNDMFAQTAAALSCE